MGTLFEQAPRKTLSVADEDVIELINKVKAISQKTSFGVEQVLKCFEIKQQERRNDLGLHNGDIHDEQMAGFGKLILDISSNLERISAALEER